jgi:hypothetical protein
MDAPDSSPGDKVDDIARAIVRYLEAHPHAADTADGITRWWLAPMLSAVPADALERALKALVASGRLLRDSPGDGGFVYRRGPNTSRPE